MTLITNISSGLLRLYVCLFNYSINLADIFFQLIVRFFTRAFTMSSRTKNQMKVLEIWNPPEQMVSKYQQGS